MVLFTVTMACMAILVWGMGVAIWRFSWIRPRGIPVCTAVYRDCRRHRWQHGVIILGEDAAKLYLLRSLKPGADLSCERHNIEIVGRRDVKTVVLRLLADPRIVELQAGDVRVDVAGGHAMDMALVAWLESAPSTRIQRLSKHPRRVKERGYRFHRHS